MRFNKSCTLTISIIIMEIVSMAGCSKRPESISSIQNVSCYMFERSSTSPDAEPSNPTFVLWSDGTYVVSERFPRRADAFLSGVMNHSRANSVTQAIRAAIQSCNGFSIIAPGNQTVLLRHLEYQVDVPRGMFDEKSGFQLTPCVHSIREAARAITDARAAKESPPTAELMTRLADVFGPTLNLVPPVKN